MDAVRSVWANNFAAESDVLRDVAPRARYVALNVQYPGCVVHCHGRNHYELTPEERYQVIRANVNALKPLQVGLAIRTDDGRCFAWEFNLRDFDIASDDSRDSTSIAYLADRGVDFGKLPWSGIDAFRLRWLLRSSGLLNSRPSWATFAGAYHVAYFAKIMLGEKLPAGVDAFTKTVSALLGSDVYDVKRLAREHSSGCRGALKDIAKQLGVVPPEEGAPELAGACSALALQAFEVLKEKLGGNTENRGELCGLQVI